MKNPFLQECESSHQYKGKTFVVDCHKHDDGFETWQCSDISHIVRARSKNKNKAIEYAHREWDEYLNQKQ